MLAVCYSVAAWGQGSAESSVRGNLSGTVVDVSGAIINQAKITLSGPTGTKVGLTDQDGRFMFSLLSPGFYGVKIEKGSFKSADIKNIEVVTGKTSSIRIALMVGSVSETVTVEGSAIAVDTTSTAVGANLTDRFYNAVPFERGVANLFFASSGVGSGLGAGPQNPSISGGSGLENLYVADGVSITDGAFGGLGVYSRDYGSLGSGINLSFVKEVQVKTGGFEAQYGKSTGGIIQIVTKSGGNSFHGEIGGYLAPASFERERLQRDDFLLGNNAFGVQGQIFNLSGKLLDQSEYEADAEFSGYVPGSKDRLFFFASFDPTWAIAHERYSQFHNLDCTTCAANLGDLNVETRTYNYAAKGTWKINASHQIETSIFGDPAGRSASPRNLATSSRSADSKLDFGTRNLVIRYNGAFSPSWLLNGSFTWNHNHFTETPRDPDVYRVTNLTQTTPCNNPVNGVAGGLPCVSEDTLLRGSNVLEGTGGFENTRGDTWGFNLDSSKSFRLLGTHNVTLGYRFDLSSYDGARIGTGAPFTVPDCNFNSSECGDTLYGPGSAGTVGKDFFVVLGMRRSQNCPASVCPALDIPGFTSPRRVYFVVNGGDGLPFDTTGRYHTLFAQDSWSINKYVTINAGLRWEQQQLQGNTIQYTFTDNWSPRVGLSVDPWGDRKSKFYVNFGRYGESMPLDIAIRSLSNQFGIGGLTFSGPDLDADGQVDINPDGTITPILDQAHLISFNNPALCGTGNPCAGGAPLFHPGISVVTITNFAPGTRMQYLDEYVAGFEHEFGSSGVIFSARYLDRRIKRVVEDIAALSPEAAQFGLSQQFLTGNVGKSTDVFVNPRQSVYFDPNVAAGNPIDAISVAGTPCANSLTYGGTDPNVSASSVAFDSNFNPITDSSGNNAFCILNQTTAGQAGPDGIADGFVDPVRIYKAVEFEVNKSFSKNWQVRANYRIAKLYGNYEGLFRNDNGQSDPNISSLFDFTEGNFNLLGQQFASGVLNSDVRHTMNGFFSYTFANHWMKGLTLGTAVRYQTGFPISNLYAHPAYGNSGEVPFCADETVNCASARGALGRTTSFGAVDLSVRYPVRLSEKLTLTFLGDLFNITSNRQLLNVNQFHQTTVGIPNADFLKPAGFTRNNFDSYQRPFHARFGLKLQF